MFWEHGLEYFRGFALEIAKSEQRVSVLPNGARTFHIKFHLDSAFLFQNYFGFQSIFVISSQPLNKRQGDALVILIPVSMGETNAELSEFYKKFLSSPILILC